MQKGNNIGITGVSWNVKLMPLRVLGNGGLDEHIYDAIRYAADNGANIINLSLGVGSGLFEAEKHLEETGNIEEAYQKLIPGSFDEWKKAYPIWYQNYYDALKYASDKGVVIVVAMGNDSLEARYGAEGRKLGNTDIFTSLPADFGEEIPGLISVVAINNKGDKSNFSSFGSKASIAAPGGEGSGNAAIYSTSLENSYIGKAGTSMAIQLSQVLLHYSKTQILRQQKSRKSL